MTVPSPQMKRAVLCSLVLGGVTVFILVVGALHVLQDDYDPVHQLMSELALGQHGKLMVVAFCGISVAVFSIQGLLNSCEASLTLQVLLVAAAVAFALAGVFPLGETATLHIASIAAAFVLSVLAMYLFPRAAGSGANCVSKWFTWSMAAGVAGSVALSHSALPIGSGQRMASGFLLSWLGVVGWNLRKQ